MVAQALRLHQTTVDHYISGLLNNGKLKPENGGSKSTLSTEQTSFLISQLLEKLFHYAHEIVAYTKQCWNINFSIQGIKKCLHLQNTISILHKFSEEKKCQFIEYNKELKKHLIYNI